MKILVIGSCGTLGKLIAKNLEDEFDVFGTDIAQADGDPRYRQADITDFAQILDVMKGMDRVVHLAVASGGTFDQTPGETSISDFEKATMRVNVNGTFHIFEAAHRLKIQRLVYMSSMTALLGNRHCVRYDSSTPLEPTNLYASTKIFGENIARAYWNNHGVSTISLRLGQPFPIGHAFDNDWKTNTRRRAIFVAVEDVCQAVRCALKTDIPFGLYHIVSASDNQRVDIETAREIGYVPRAYLTSERVQWIEDGCFPPPPGPVVTHNPEDLLPDEKA